MWVGSEVIGLSEVSPQIPRTFYLNGQQTPCESPYGTGFAARTMCAIPVALGAWLFAHPT